MTQLLNMQQAFDKSVLGVLRQGRQSSFKGYCTYFRDGLKCAVGQLIPHEVYRAGMEGMSVKNLLQFFPTLLDDCGVEDTPQMRGMLLDLQAEHDNPAEAGFLPAFYAGAQVVARKYGLTMPEFKMPEVEAAHD